MYVGERHFKNEDSIKEAIVDAHARGVCDSEGRTYPKGRRRAPSKGDRLRYVDKKRYDENYVLAFGHE
jgi:hypothetical protein